MAQHPKVPQVTSNPTFSPITAAQPFVSRCQCMIPCQVRSDEHYVRILNNYFLYTLPHPTAPIAAHRRGLAGILVTTAKNLAAGMHRLKLRAVRMTEPMHGTTAHPHSCAQPEDDRSKNTFVGLQRVVCNVWCGQIEDDKTRFWDLALQCIVQKIGMFERWIGWPKIHLPTVALRCTYLLHSLRQSACR